MTYTILRTPYIFRYIGSSELDFIVRNGIIYSYNPRGTYWTTLLTDDPHEAQRRLSLPKPPLYRIGGFLLRDIDPRDIVYRGTVAPAYGQPGGAEEILLKIPIPIVSVFDMQSKKTLYSYLK